MTPKYLALGPGGMGYFALLGCLRNLDLSKVLEVSGASAGAIVGMFISMDKTVPEILNMTLALNMKELSRLNMMSITKGFGLISKDPIRRKMVEMCGSDPSFKELSKKLYVSAYCLEKAETVYFSKDTDPDMKVIDAVCMSMAVPILIEATRHEGNLYIDGGMVETVPMLPFVDRKKEETLAIQMIVGGGPDEKVTTIFQYVSRLVRAIIKRIEYADTHKIYLGKLNIFNFNMSYDDKLKMFLATDPFRSRDVTVPVEKLTVVSVSTLENTT